MDSKFSDRVIALFRKAWAAFPQQRYSLIAYVKRDDVWQMPEIYDYAREAIIPRDGGSVAVAPWTPFVPLRIQSGGPQTGKPVVLLLAEAAAKRGKLDELAHEIAAARKKIPSWTAGEALLAIVLCRAGRYDEAEAVVRALPETVKKDTAAASGPYLFYAYFIVASELEQNRRSRELALEVYQHALGAPSSYLQFRFERDQTPLGRLVDLYRRERRPDDARRALITLARGIQLPDDYPAELTSRYKMLGLDSIARELIGLGFAADAIPVLCEAVDVAATVDPNNVPPVLTAIEGLQSPEQIRQHLDTALRGVNAPELAALAGRLIGEALEVPPVNANPDGPKPPKPRDQALDLVLMIYPSELDKARVRSLLAESLAACDARQLAALDPAMELLRKAHPGDLSVAIAGALRALAGDDPLRAETAIQRLLQLLEETPPGPHPDGDRPGARDRALAARLIPLYVVARACSKQSSAATRALGDRLAARAFEAAARQSDKRWMLAMLREQGQDRAGARRHCRRAGCLEPDAQPGRRP